jgi:predicted nucleic acid-binding protein
MNSRVCVDANVIVWSMLAYPLSEAAEALLNSCQQNDTILIAPSLLAFEVTSTLRRLVYLKQITPKEGERAFARFMQFDIHYISHTDIYSRAWELAKELNRPRAYDTAYLAVAQLHQCDFWTADEKFYNAVQAKAPWVKWLGDFAPSA